MPNRLKEILDENGITQTTLSKESNVSSTTLSKVCNNKIVVTLRTQFKILHGLNSILQNHEHSWGTVYKREDIFLDKE